MGDQEQPKTTRVYSPSLTGGTGFFFEQHVGAYWLSQLLVGAIPPILISATVNEVSFQAKRLGWETDDLLIKCSENGIIRNIACQVKRSFTVSASDEECKKTFADFWRDFNGSHFSKEYDRLALVTLRGTNTLLEHLVGLLDCARAARDGADFEKRLSTDGYISKTPLRYCNELLEIVGDLEGKPVNAASIWPFLRVIHVLSLDLDSSTRQTEAHIKSMLSLTTTDGDPVANAATTWNELLVEASTAMSSSRSLLRDDLPMTTLGRHGVINTEARRVLQALTDHTAPILRSIRSTIGPDLHLSRANIVQNVLEALEITQVVLITGPAGSGKSAIGKDVFGVLSSDHFMFGFRVEEFAKAHMDATLSDALVQSSWARLRAILGAQNRKVVLVESVERLLEKTSRDAFTDLMMMAADDRGLQIVLTCRDYSAEQVRSSFLHQHGISHTVVHVPPLNDTELSEVEATYPPLGTPLKNPVLRNVLRNPFILDKALVIEWSVEKSFPQSEREFRAIFWREIVRSGIGITPSMGRLRDEALRVIAVRRAQALSTHVSTNGIDVEVIESLHSDSLITSSQHDPNLISTAHDVIEDWAIMQWIDAQHLSDASINALSDAIGTHPAVRRSYRKWVSELLDRDPTAADRLFRAAVSSTEITMQFRDDTLVSLLKAPLAPVFLARHEAQLLFNDRALLKRIIHLLRVACVKTHDLLDGTFGQGSILNVPDGSAWPAVLRLVNRNLEAFQDKERAFLIGLVEDAVRGVSWLTPDVEGAQDIAGTAHWLLGGLRGYGGDDPRKRILNVIAKIPKADATRFEEVLRGHTEDTRLGRRRLDAVAEDFQKLIYTGIEGWQAARDLPDVVISIARNYLLASDDDIDYDRRYTHSSLEIDLYFGIKEGVHLDSFPASAYRGPWLPLLRNHSAKAIDFFILVFNHSADWYAHPHLSDHLEEAWEVELTFSDGSTRKLWTNFRLWGLYRGMTVGPYSLQSMLMALESWLLEIGKQQPDQLDGILVEILRRSENAAIAAVIASVATAFPQSAGEALLILLSVRDYFDLDRSRMVGDFSSSSMIGFNTMRADHRVHEMERKMANNLTHRRNDLESAIANLQFGPFRERVHTLLDKHLSALPPKEEQDESDQLWRLAIHRMDLRQYTVSDTIVKEIPDDKAKLGDPSQRYIQLNSKPLDADLEAIVDKSASVMAVVNARLGLLMWGIHAFRRENGKYDPEQWTTKLNEAQAMDHNVAEQDGSHHGPGFVATVCIRDHWDGMTAAQQDWCVDIVCAEVMRHSNAADHIERYQNNPMAADRPCATILTTLLRKPLDPTRVERVKTAFVAALVHPIEQVKWHATLGVDDQVWAIDRALALRCINALAAEVDLINKIIKERPSTYHGELHNIIAEAKIIVRSRFWEEGGIAEETHITLDFSEDFGSYAIKYILTIFGNSPHDQQSIDAFERASQTLVNWWTSSTDYKSGRSRNFQLESDVSRCIQEFLLRTTPEAAHRVLLPLLAAIDTHSRELYAVMQQLTVLQDTNPNTSQYWMLWGLIAGAVKRASWVTGLDKDRHPDGTELLSAVFLTSSWHESVRHWRYLEGHEKHIHNLFNELPPSSIVLDDYTRFLYHIGEQSLPEAFLNVANTLRRGNPQRLLSLSNTIFMLEVLLERFVYGRPLELKRDKYIRDAVLLILDCLVESGSSAAFRMRDDFVTPISPT